MATEIKVVQHVDDVVQSVFVTPPQMVQNADFHQSLVMEPLLIPAKEIKRVIKSSPGYSIKDKYVINMLLD